MNKIVVCSNPFRDLDEKIAARACEVLTAAGFETQVCTVFGDAEQPERLVEAMQGAALAVAIGGDGTFLHVARLVAGLETPIIGINMGNKGFLAGLEAYEVDRLVDVARGNYRESHRMMLDVTLHRADGSTETDFALNDVVLKGDVNAIMLSLYSDGTGMTDYSGDGVIISTPTGSTAYSMSAGGPIVEPEARNIIVTPICAHDLAVRSFVLPPERTVKVIPDKIFNRRAMLAVDGSDPIDLLQGDSISVCCSKNSTIVAELGTSSFYDITRGKLTHS